MKTKFWIVGKVLSREDNTRWEFAGLSDDQLEAESWCTGELFFVAPVELGVPFGDETMDFPDCYYPNIEGSKCK